MPRYRHTQFGTVTAIALGGGATVSGVVLVLTWHPVAGAVFAVLFFCLALFCSLTVEIDDEALRVWFGPGLIRRTIALRDIRDAYPVRNRWYWGWGARYTPHGWMFNVAGLDAVEIAFSSGKKFRIGTDEPGELARELKECVGVAGESLKGGH